MKTIVVVAPHPDDETLGCGGTLLRHRKSGDKIHWVIATSTDEASGFSKAAIQMRDQEIESVAKSYEFSSVTRMNLPVKRLDTLPVSEIIDKFSECFKKIKPDTVLLPFQGDAHTDHHVIFEAASACTKWFRFPSISKVLAYETISETDMALNNKTFSPNLFIDITKELKAKLQILNIYVSEMGSFPFPRSPEAIESLARVRGAASGFQAAEAFMTLRERR